MTTASLVALLREALYLCVLVAAPPLLAAAAAGLISGALQAATRVEDAALSSVPKLFAALAALLFAAPWIGAELLRFTHLVMQALPAAGRS